MDSRAAVDVVVLVKKNARGGSVGSELDAYNASVEIFSLIGELNVLNALLNVIRSLYAPVLSYVENTRRPSLKVFLTIRKSNMQRPPLTPLPATLPVDTIKDRIDCIFPIVRSSSLAIMMDRAASPGSVVPLDNVGITNDDLIVFLNSLPLRSKNAISRYVPKLL